MITAKILFKALAICLYFGVFKVI